MISLVLLLSNGMEVNDEPRADPARDAVGILITVREIPGEKFGGTLFASSQDFLYHKCKEK